MYEVKLPKQINPLRLGQQNEKLCGYFLTENMSRLLTLVDSVAERVEVELNFKLDVLNRPLAQGIIQIATTLICQRCLKPFVLEIIGKVNWAFVQDDEQAKRIQQDYDPVLVEDERMNLFLQIEDEILLNLPMISLHQDFSEFRPVNKKPDETTKTAKVNPFAELANFKIKK